jgi:hypothetical protein
MNAPKRALILATSVTSAALLSGAAAAGNGSDGSTFGLSSYDGTTLAAVNDQGHSFLAQFGATTALKPAALDRYIPNDPYKAACGQAAANYNGALIVATSDGGLALTQAITSLAALGCKAKVLFDAQDPYHPGDPYVPPNPIKMFQPVP